jgi:hypothetical protein
MRKAGMPDKDVVIDVVLGQQVQKKPYLVIYNQGYKLTEGLKVEPKSPYRNSYVFDLKNQSRPLYFSLRLTDGVMDIVIANKFHFEPGDHVKINLNGTKIPNNYDLRFSGTGSAKYICRNKFEEMIRSDQQPDFKDEDYHADHRTLVSVAALYRLIESYKPEMSYYAYNLLHADTVGYIMNSIFRDLNSRLSAMLERGDTRGFRRIANDFRAEFKYDFTSNIPGHVIVDSKEYADFLLQRIKCQVIIENGRIDYHTFYKNIKRVENGRLRDKMIVKFIAENWRSVNDNFEDLLTDALQSVDDKEILVKLYELRSFSSTINL